MIKKIIFICCAILTTGTIFCQTIDVMTYNIRYDNPGDGKNSWSERKEFLLGQMKYFTADIIGTQEGLKHQVEYIDNELENYSYVGIGRDENSSGEYCALFYNKDKVKLVTSETFWLSETPDVPSKGWDASLNRICTYGLFETKKTQQKFWIYNTHFDHRGIKARERSADLILKKIDSLNTENLPIILLGDFNLKPEEKPIKIISSQLNDSKTVSISEPFGPEGTFNGFDVCKPTKNRIDYIFTSKNKIKVNKYASIANIDSVRYPSDHLPVLINITFN